MDICDLKEYIIEDEERIVKILDDLGCHGIKDYQKEYRCGLPNKTNTTSVVVNKSTLSMIIRTEEETIKGDILTLAMRIKNIKFYDGLKYIHEVLNIPFTLYKSKKAKQENKIDPLAVFKKIKRKRNVCNVLDLDMYDENILSDYLPYIHIDWVRDGISPRTSEEFNIGFSNKLKRIIIPHRSWSGTKNDWLGVVGRTVIKEYKMLDIPKYLAIKRFPKSANMYGLNENYRHIQEQGYVVVHEAEKSVLKRHSRFDKTGVAVCSHDLSREQVRILISLNVDIVIAYDKGVDIKHIRSECAKFYGVRNVYYIWDKWGVLQDKEAPADKANKVYEFLFKRKVKYDHLEHQKYLKSIEECKEKTS